MTRRLLLPLAVLLLLALCLLFGWWQNRHGFTGGDISAAKVLWLFLALTLFLLIPAWLWRDPLLHPDARRFWGWFLTGWIARGVIEMPLLLLTNLWRCEHGIAHDLVMLAFLLTFGLRVSANDRLSHRLAPLTAAALVAEMLNAALFAQAGKPETGQYFAGADPVFLWINRITWAEIILLTPWLTLWLREYTRRDRLPA